MLQDFRFAWRRLRMAPGPALFAIATLTLGIGAATATYSFVDTALWRPLGIADESHVLLLSRTNMFRPGPNPAQFEDFQRIADAHDQIGLSSVAGFCEFQATVVGHGSGVLSIGDFVTPEFFTTLGVQPQLGRLFGGAHSTDDRAAVLSDAAWRSQFGADPSVIGASITVANQPFTVIGVAPEGFRGLRPQSLVYPSVWLPLTASAAVTAAAKAPFPVTSVDVVTRVAASRTAGDGAAALGAFGLSLDQSHPLPPTQFPDHTVRPQPRYWTGLAPSDDAGLDMASELGRVVVLLPGLVLLIACTNIANLVLSRNASRRQDFGVRRALGASRWQLVREQLVEQGIIAVVGGLGAVVVAQWLLRSAAHLMQTTFAPFVSGAPIDWHVHGGLWQAAVFGILLSLLVSGLIPALQLTRDSLRTVLAQGDATSTPRWRGRGNLIALQLGVSVGLFLIALVFVQIVVTDTKPKRAQVATASADAKAVAIGMVPFSGQGRDDTYERGYVERALATLGGSPGVEAAAVTTAPTTIRGLGRIAVAGVSPTILNAQLPTPASGQREFRFFAFAGVSPTYFATMKIPLTRGHVFDADDDAAIVVTEDVARTLTGTNDAVGRSVTLTVQDGSSVPSRDQTMTIVGIVPASAPAPTGDQQTGVVYAPFARHIAPSVTFLARGRAGDPAPIDAMTRALATVEPEVAMAFVSTVDVLARGPLAFAGYIAGALFTLAGLALGMATVGLYGVLSHVIARRTREFGIRMALGATPRAITTLVLRDGARPILEGLFIGLATAAVIRFFMLKTMIQESVGSIDPWAFLLSVVLLSVAGVFACWLPARRATRVTPIQALRSL